MFLINKGLFPPKGLATNHGEGGGLQNGSGGHVKFDPNEKESVEKVLAMLKGGGATKSFGVGFYVVA